MTEIIVTQEFVKCIQKEYMQACHDFVKSSRLNNGVLSVGPLQCLKRCSALEDVAMAYGFCVIDFSNLPKHSQT